MHADAFLREAAQIASEIDAELLERMVLLLEDLRERKGRLFLLGLGGSAANCSHAAADFRKLCDIQAQAPTDNVAEFSARLNDDGYSSVFTGWLEASDAGINDALFVLSVGGGTGTVSLPLVRALHYAEVKNMLVLGIVGPHGGETARHGDCVIKVPADDEHITPHTEAFQAVIWHCLVSHPKLQKRPTKW